MRRYSLKRLLQLFPVLLGVTFLSFAMMRLAGSDAITELYGDKGRCPRRSSTQSGRSWDWTGRF